MNAHVSANANAMLFSGVGKAEQKKGEIINGKIFKKDAILKG